MQDNKKVIVGAGQEELNRRETASPPVIGEDACGSEAGRRTLDEDNGPEHEIFTTGLTG